MLINTQNIDLFNPQVLFITHSVANGEHVPKTQYHCHNFIEFSIVTSGQLNYNIEGSYHELKKDDVMVFNPGVYHQALINRDTICTELHIGIENLNIDCLSPNYMRALEGAPIVSIKKYKEEFTQCCNEIVKEHRLKPLGHSFVLKSLVMKLIIILYREMDQCSYPPSRQTTELISSDNKVIVQSLIDYMSFYYMEAISLDYLSRIMYLSPAYISKIFKEETGTSPINFLIEIRLEKARELLEATPMNIKEISKTVGYSDAYYFSRLFKKHYGKSPSTWREDNI